MIVVLKTADFSANNLGQIIVPEEINPFTYGAIAASGNTFTNEQTQAINTFFKTIGAFDDSGVFSKIDLLYLPMLAVDVTKALVNYKDNSVITVSDTRYSLRNKGLAAKSGGSGDYVYKDSFFVDISDMSFFAFTTEQFPSMASDLYNGILMLNNSVWVLSQFGQLNAAAVRMKFMKDSTTNLLSPADFNAANNNGFYGMSINNGNVIAVASGTSYNSTITLPATTEYTLKLYPMASYASGSLSVNAAAEGAIFIGKYMSAEDITILKTAVSTLYSALV